MLSRSSSSPSSYHTPAPSDSESDTSFHTPTGSPLSLPPARSRDTSHPLRSLSARPASPGATTVSAQHDITVASAPASPVVKASVPASPSGSVASPIGKRASRMASAAKSLAKMSDIHTLLSHADDAAFVRQLAGDPAHDQAGELQPLVNHIADFKTQLAASDLPGELKQALGKRLGQIDVALHELVTVTPVAGRVAKIATIHSLLAPLPLMIPMMSKPAQQKTEAELIALISKAMVEGVGMMRHPTAGNQLIKDRTMARYYINVVQALEFALPTFVGSLRFLNDSKPFNTALGVVSTIALFAGFMGKDIKRKYNQKIHHDPHPQMAKMHKQLFGAAAATPEQHAATQNIRQILQQLKQHIDTDKQALMSSKEHFTADGMHELSPHMGKQVSIAVDAYHQLADELISLMGTREQAVAVANPDRNAKLALAVFATVVCTGTTALMLPDTIGTVDLASDTLFTSALMFSQALNPDVGRKDALEEFKTFVGLSLVMLAMLTANKGGKDFMAKGMTGLLIGSITMSALNLALPGPVGHYAASGLEKLMNLKPSELIASAKDIGHRVYQMLCGFPQQPPKPSSVVITELTEVDLERGVPA